MDVAVLCCMDVAVSYQGERVEFHDDKPHLAFRIFSSEVFQSQEARQLAGMVHSAPHYDAVHYSIDWPEGTLLNHTISFTLPIKLPPVRLILILIVIVLTLTAIILFMQLYI